MVSDLATTISSEFSHCSIEMANLYGKLKQPADSASIDFAVCKLERAGLVYIERFPRIENGQLRLDLRDADIVHFNQFPTVKRKSLLYRTNVEYGDYAANHIVGCAHGCTYPCYAMMLSKRFGRIANAEQWMHPRIVSNSLALLDREIPKIGNEIRSVHLSFMTDPFMFDSINRRNYFWIQEHSLGVIKKLNSYGIRVFVLTKGLYPRTLISNRLGKENEYGISLVSLEPGFASRFEPFSARPSARIKSLKYLSRRELKTWVSIEPYPTPSIQDQNLPNLLNKVKFVDKIVFGRWNYNKEVSSYQHLEEFYRRCVDNVLDFCAQQEIECHIKAGTPHNAIPP